MPTYESVEAESDPIFDTQDGEETEPAQTELFENSGLVPSEPVMGSASLSKPYAEKVTTTTADDWAGNLEGDNIYNDGELSW